MMPPFDENRRQPPPLAQINSDADAANVEEFPSVQFRVGLGHDTHRLGPGRRFVLGGVEIDNPVGPIGHSDADVLLHALVDAILGAAGMGDIGEWFPDTDPEWEGADSAKLLTETLLQVRARGWNVVNVDCTIFAERPKLSPHKTAIRRRLAELLDMPAEGINVKAKTGEAVGPIGRGEAIGADVVLLLAREDESAK